jgi:DNA-binding transcriptional MerR regulator
MKRKVHVRETPDFLRSLARREARCIGQYGWRPSKQDLANLRASTRDAIAYRTMARAWRSAGFKLAAIRKLAKLKPRGRNSPPPRARGTSSAASRCTMNEVTT